MIRSVRHTFCALAAIALAATPALAQEMPHINMMPEVKTRTPEELERDEKINKAYRETLRKIPDAKSAADPWGDVRGAEASPKVAPKPKQAGASPPKRAKAASSAN